jgi:endonuclease YncB( thermonuclease family)
VTIFALLKKASLVGAFFVSVGCALAQAACPLPGKLPQVKVQRVVDGDTVRLVDGRTVRLIGLNSPELAHRGRAAEPFAVAARAYLSTLVAANGGRVGVQLGEQRQDRYGRTLAHLYDQDGQNLEAQMLAQGLALMVAISPNVTLVGCHRLAEHEARKRSTGLWKQLRPITPGAIRRGGFVLLEGVVQRVERNRGGVWLELGSSTVLHIAAQALQDFASLELEALRGRRIEARGWVVDRARGGTPKSGQARWMLSLNHPAMFETLP